MTMTDDNRPEDEVGKTRSLLSDKVHRVVRERIMRGEYMANERLPAEKDLSLQLGVSRPILRIALERLRDEGLIYSRQGAGNFVRVMRGAPLAYARVETIADIQRCYEFRLTVETDGAALAASRWNDEAMAEAERALQLLSEATGSRVLREDAHFSFHLAIARCTNNRYYEDTMEALRDDFHVGTKLHGEWLVAGGATALDEVFAEHKSILEAIKSRDSEAARQRMRQHVTHSRDRLFGGTLVDL